MLEHYYDVIERLDAFSSVLTVIPGVDFCRRLPVLFLSFSEQSFHSESDSFPNIEEMQSRILAFHSKNH